MDDLQFATPEARPPAESLAVGTRLALVRHGEAHCNVDSFIGGHLGCTGLTERGVAQAEALAARLRRSGELAGAAALWTSLLPRAAATAEVLAPALEGLPVEADCAVCERHPGEADGMTWEDYEARYGRRSLPGDAPELPLSPGGESWVDFLDRAAASLRDLAKRYEGELVVVVTHGGVIDASLIRFLSMPEHGTAVRLHPEHTSITEWQFTGARWRLVRYSDAAHILERRAEIATPSPEWVGTDPGPFAARGPRA